jgi:formate dehydrogenase gamma subunit
MKRYVSITVVVLFVLLAVVYQFEGAPRAQAQSAAIIQPASQTAGQPVTATLATDSDAATKEDAKQAAGSLDCAACHGSGKTLPYLGGGQFHAYAHKAYDHGFHARAIQNGRNAASCLDCHSLGADMATILPASNPRSTINRANIAKTCGSCHGSSSVMDGTGISNRPFVSYQESVHARAILHGNTKAAVCTDCHNSHDITPASESGSPIFKANISKTCGQCHSNIAGEYNQSVHGEAVARGVSRSPVCTDCHGIHNIKPHIDPATAKTSQALATGSCSQCHEGVALSREFGVPSGRVSSYQDSYHGLASKLGSKVVANCASCHGVHNILPSADSRSMVNQANLVNTCGQCHPGAGENFVAGKIHLNVPAAQDGAASGNDIGAVVSGWVRWLYLWLIGVVIGGMFIHNVLVWRKKALARRRAQIRPIVRMTGRQRIQHVILLTSFTVLVLTGFALKYPDSWLAALLVGESFRRITHRMAGVVMLAAGLFHVYYLLLTTEGRRALVDMFPRRKDITDFIQAMRYYGLGNPSKPKFAKFNYGEKAEYWAVVWGTIIMGLTGLMVWFKVEVFSFLPRWIIDVALSVHFYEAILATLAIIVWHFYNVIFDPDVYPLNWAVVDGRVSEEYYKEEHELDYEQMMSVQDEQHRNSEEFKPDPSKERNEVGAGLTPFRNQGD